MMVVMMMLLLLTVMMVHDGSSFLSPIQQAP
jgi:hypothetical protein